MQCTKYSLYLVSEGKLAQFEVVLSLRGIKDVYIWCCLKS